MDCSYASRLYTKSNANDETEGLMRACGNRAADTVDRRRPRRKKRKGVFPSLAELMKTGSRNPIGGLTFDFCVARFFEAADSKSSMRSD